MTDPEQQAILDGQQARLMGRAITENPFPLESINARRWSAGWREIDDMERSGKRA